MSWVGNANKYVVVSADSSVADAEDVRQFISCHLSKMCSDSTCYTYENIRYVDSPCIEALFLPGLGGYVTALTGRALDWQSRGQRFDPAYLHQKDHNGSCGLSFLLF